MKNNLFKTYQKEILSLLVLLIAYVPSFMWMWDRWFARDSYYSHGILVPFVSLFFVWQLRGELAKIKRSCSPWGVKLIAAGILVHIVSSMFRVNFSSAFSFLVVFYGLVLHFFGGRIFKKILFPLMFLLFMVPLPMAVISNISFRLKMFAAQLAEIVINKMGIPAIRKGSMIIMRDSYVVVDDVCSGLRSLISLTALGSIFAYMFDKGTVKRVVLFLSTIPIAVFTNMCRVVALSVISEVWGSQYASGMVHDITGFMVFVVAFLLLLAVQNLLE